MSYRSYRSVTYWVWTFMILHCSLMLIYAWPQNFRASIWRKVAAIYAEPVFRQQWSMFAPDPPLYHIEWSYRKPSGQWVYPGRSRIKKYRSNRLLPRAKIYQLVQHIGFFLVRDYTDIVMKGRPSPYPENASITDFKDSFGYRAARHYINQQMPAKVQGKVDLRVIRYYPRIAKKDSRTDTLNLPGFQLE